MTCSVIMEMMMMVIIKLSSVAILMGIIVRARLN